MIRAWLRRWFPTEPSDIIAWFIAQERHKQDALLLVLNKVRDDQEYASSFRNLL